MDEPDRDLEEAVDDLTEVLERLGDELDGRQPRPSGFPRPPSPREVLRFTERYTIPTVIAVLQTSIRVLELLSATLRYVDGRSPETDDPSGYTPGVRGRERLATVSRTTLRTLDDALADLQDAVAGGEPDSPEVRDLLAEARALRAEVDDRLTREIDRESADGTDTDAEEASTASSDDQGIDIDIDSELESIKRDVDRDEGESGNGEDGHDDDGGADDGNSDWGE